MSPKTMKLLAKPMLFAAALIWGTSFFIMKNTLDVMPVFYLLAVRFTVGAGLLALVCWKKWREFTPDYLWRGAVIGGFLFLAYSIQTFGLSLTTPSKNAFLTAVYCVIVPFLTWAVLRIRPDGYNIAAALLCITGVGLVSLNGELAVNAGDLLTMPAISWRLPRCHPGRISRCLLCSSSPLPLSMPGFAGCVPKPSPLPPSPTQRSFCLWRTCV